ncbi:MAG: efflux RND transporter permease subunit [Victivallaceae bacterium]|nr:efflux RND transporter permease subunit [Victivallaceae bacterium]
MFSKIFIDHPKLAFVLSILMALAGVLSITKLPIAEYPEIAPPCIYVVANYPGASAQVITETIASTIEEEANGIENMIYYNSESENSTYYCCFYFKPGTNSDIAQVNVQNAVQRATTRLPAEVTNIGVKVAKRSTDIAGVYVFLADPAKMTQLDLANYVRINVKDNLARLPGISYAEILGERNYSMRVWLDPLKLAALNLSTSDVSNAITSQNIQAAAGAVGDGMASQYMQFKIDTVGRLRSTEQFAAIIVKTTGDGRQITLGDIARLELGADSYSNNSYWNGTPSISIAIYRQDGANAIDLVNNANARLAELSARFPDGVSYRLGYDPTDYIRRSIYEIGITLISTLALVIIITYVFLQDWRATLIPSLAIPVSLLATFFVMLLLDYSINVLTMFGLILVIGSLVDDAIVVVENTMRLIQDEHLSPYDAAVKSMHQISGAIIATTLVSVAVYAPLSFYGGLVGTIYKQFSVTMCVALSFSTLNALTLSPALCAIVLKPYAADRKKKFILFRWFDKLLDGTKRGYLLISGIFVRRITLTILLIAGVLGCNYGLFSMLKGGFLPNEDKGAILCELMLPPGSALLRTDKSLSQFTETVSRIPGVKNVITVSGFSFISGLGENIGLGIVVLDDWDLRKTPERSIEAIRMKIMKECAAFPDATVNAFQPPAIMGLGATGGVSCALKTNGDRTTLELEQYLNKFLYELNNKQKMPNVMFAFSPYNARMPQLYLDIDRRKAEAMGVPVSRIFATMQSKLASLYINDFNIYGYSFKVKLQVDADERKTVTALEEMQIPNNSGAQVPLSSLATVRYIIGAQKITRFEQSMAATVNVIPIPGASSGQIMNQMEEFVAKNLPNDFSLSWTDMSYQERGNEGKLGMLMVLAFLFGYLFLVAQYGSWVIPLPVMISVSFATLGGLAGLHLSGMQLDIYGQLGLIMLIGLAAKSAILMVEFSKQEREAGKSIAESAMNGANFRYRAVLMTAWSFVVGVLPLMFATGAGAESRRVIGVTTGWGMIVATAVGIAFIPPLYSWWQTWREKSHCKCSAQQPR